MFSLCCLPKFLILALFHWKWDYFSTYYKISSHLSSRFAIGYNIIWKTLRCRKRKDLQSSFLMTVFRKLIVSSVSVITSRRIQLISIVKTGNVGIYVKCTSPLCNVNKNQKILTSFVKNPTNRISRKSFLCNLMFFWPCIMNWLYINYQLDALIIIYL